MKGIEERPSNQDFIGGWNKFFKLVSSLKPNYCLFCGVAAASFNGAFIEAAKNNTYKAENISHGTKVGNVALRASTIEDENGFQTKLLFIRHPSSYFNWNEWNIILKEQIPDYLKSLK